MCFKVESFLQWIHQIHFWLSTSPIPIKQEWNIIFTIYYMRSMENPNNLGSLHFQQNVYKQICWERAGFFHSADEWKSSKQTASKFKSSHLLVNKLQQKINSNIHTKSYLHWNVLSIWLTTKRVLSYLWVNKFAANWFFDLYFKNYLHKCASRSQYLWDPEQFQFRFCVSFLACVWDHLKNVVLVFFG